MTHAIPFVILALASLGLARAAYSLWRKGAFIPVLIWWRGASRLLRCLVTVLVLTAVAYGSDKILGGYIGEGMRTLGGAVASLCTNIFTASERLTGYAVSSAGTNETHDLTMPENAQLAEGIAKRGAHDDGGWYFDAYTNRLARDGLDLGNPVWIHTDGTVTLRSPAPGVPIQELAQTSVYSNITVYAPLQGSYGFLPATMWPDFMPSLIWTATTDKGSRVVTWEGARLERDVSRPVSFQAEFHENGEVTYRYDTFPTNGVATGVFRNGSALASDSGAPQSLQEFLGFQDIPGYSALQPADITSLTLSYIGDLSDGSGDTDDDGLTDWEEVKRHHTDPHDADTDGDGLVDGYEVQNGTDPLNPDSNGDGMPDGWSQEQYDAHRLFNGQEGDRIVTITLQASTPASNRAVLRIGDMPVLLCETNTWTFSIPTGTVWNVELRTDGLPVQLALEAGAGIFAENANAIFASCLLEEEQQEPLRSAPPPTRSAATGSSGGNGKIYAPCIFLEPSMQVVHENESATVWAKCVPDTPSLSGKLTWSFEPDYMAAYVDVASNKLSATVSGMDDEWHSSVTLHATAGNSLNTQAVVHFCNGHSNPTNGIVFPPNHTNMTINPIYRDCEHPFGDDEEDPKFYLEVEAGRATASGWQHLAWIDTNPNEPGLQQRTAISRDNPPSIDWDTKATSSAPLTNGTDSLVYDGYTTFTRALPAVASGQYVPPPFVTIISRTFDEENNLVSEVSTTQAIPQYVKITWTTNAVEEFRQPIVFNYPGANTLAPTNVTIFAGCSAVEAQTAFAGIATTVQSIFPSGANIVVVGPEVNVPQPHKTIEIHSGKFYSITGGGITSDLGVTLKENCHLRNDSPSGISGVFLGAIRQSFIDQYLDFYVNIDFQISPSNDWRFVSLPFPISQMMMPIPPIAVHECCHAMGLVPAASAASDGFHNNCDCGTHYMDSGDFCPQLMRLGLVPSQCLHWITENEAYLEFVCPLTE